MVKLHELTIKTETICFKVLMQLFTDVSIITCLDV